MSEDLASIIFDLLKKTPIPISLDSEVFDGAHLIDKDLNLIATGYPFPDAEKIFWDSVRRLQAIVVDLTQGELEGLPPYALPMPPVTRFHYRDWPDLRGTSVPVLLKLIKMIEESRKDCKTPVVIHCKGGVGRTGTLITAFRIYSLWKKGVLPQEPASFEELLKELILEGRSRRKNHRFVGVPTQVAALLDFGLYLLRNPVVAAE